MAYLPRFGAPLVVVSVLVIGACGSDDEDSPGGGMAGSSGSAGASSSGGSGGPAGGSAAGGADSGGASSGGSAAGGAASGGAGSGGTGGSAGSGGSAGANSAGTNPGSGKLVDSAVFYRDISNAAVDLESETILGALEAAGWGDAGSRQTLGIDFSFEINEADPSLERRAFVQPDDALPDCDTAPVPLPPGGIVEGSPSGDYACEGGDCHLLVYQGTRLYELYQANVTGGQPIGGEFTGTCLVVWDLTFDYWQPAAPPNFSRGDHCNGADASDMPMAPLILTREEIESGEVTHAMRFTISNNRIRAGVYVHPATHIGGPSGGSDTLPYGARLRLRADYDLASLPNDAARTVARALQTYGMFLADGGNIYISATTSASDAVGGSDLGAIRPSDFDMIEGGERINWDDWDCTRTPVTD